MREVPPVRYLRHPAGAIAYQVWGQGELDLLLMTDATTSVDNIWEHPGRLRFLSSYGELGRVIRFDPRGQGASDPLPLEQVGQLGSWLDDALHVLDAVDVSGAVVCAEGFAGQVGLRLAAEHPERVVRLAMLNPFAGGRRPRTIRSVRVSKAMQPPGGRGSAQTGGLGNSPPGRCPRWQPAPPIPGFLAGPSGSVRAQQWLARSWQPRTAPTFELSYRPLPSQRLSSTPATRSS